MRSSLRSLFLSSIAAAGTCLPAWALVPLEHGRIVGSATAHLTYDSNIFLTSSEVADLAGQANGEARYVRDGGVTVLDTGVGLNAQGFLDHSAQNSVDPYWNGRVGYSLDDKVEANGNFDFRRSTIANEAVNARTRSDELVLSGLLQYLPTEKFGGRLSGEYGRSDYLTAGFSDTKRYLVGASAVHLYSPKLKLLAGVAAGESDSAGTSARRGVRTADARYSVGAEGELGPKLTGDAEIGVSHRNFRNPGVADSSTLFLTSNVTWAETEKRSWTLSGSQDFGVTAADQSARNLQVFIKMSEALSKKLSLDAGVGYTRNNYTSLYGRGSRVDDGVTLRGRLAYTVRDDLTLDVNAGYRRNNSSLSLADYSRVTIGAGVTARF